MNYCDEDIPYTRIAEHKHFTPWEHPKKRLSLKNSVKKPRKDDIPYYPKRLNQDKKLLNQYRQKATIFQMFLFSVD